MLYNRFSIYPFPFIVFIINIHVLILSVIFLRYYRFFVNRIHFIFNYSIILFIPLIYFIHLSY